MPGFGNNVQDLNAAVSQLREEGLTDSLIMEELSRKGYKADQIHQVLMQFDDSEDVGGSVAPSPAPVPPGFQGVPIPSSAAPSYGRRMPSEENNSMYANSVSTDNIYERIEEITEGIVDEKWDELIIEVKKIVEWKDKFEEEHRLLKSEIDKLKEDFKLLHQGVLGKLEEYDTRMGSVDTELRAVGKVFKDVVPQFVENVKELSFIASDLKKGKK